MLGNLYAPVVPEGAVRVTRPTRWGNPYRVGRDAANNTTAVALFEAALSHGQLPFTAEDVRTALAGKDLACWCQPTDTCHADVLLRIANQQ